MLTPLAVDPAHPFPFVSGLSLNLAVTVKQPDDHGQHFARVKVPDNVDRFVELESLGATAGAEGVVRYLPMEELIAAFLPVLFPGMEIVEHHAFRITRNADSRSKRTATKTCCKRWNGNWRAGGSVRRCDSRSPTT